MPSPKKTQRDKSVKRQFTLLFLRGDDDFVGILTACDCILGAGDFFKRNAGYEKMIDYDVE
jgi:hypothetical protein